MGAREQDDLQYRTPVTQQLASRAVPTTPNEQNYDTLRIVYDALKEGLKGLSNFNTFEIAKDKIPNQRAKILLHEVEVRQAAYDILSPLLDTVRDALAKIDEKYKEK